MSEQGAVAGVGGMELGGWIRRLEAEIARELGQAVSLVAGGEVPDPEHDPRHDPGHSLADAIEVPGARLVVAADGGEVAGFLAAARLVEEGEGDRAMVRELWAGILSSVAARLGGTRTHSQSQGPAEPYTLRLGKATLCLSIALEPQPAGSEGKGAPRGERGAGPESDEHRVDRNFNLLLEVELDASVRFGSCEMELKDLLELGPGDVVELDRHVADPVDLIVGDKIVARGEVVLVNGNFGLRITQVAEPVRRLESIRCTV